MYKDVAGFRNPQRTLQCLQNWPACCGFKGQGQSAYWDLERVVLQTGLILQRGCSQLMTTQLKGAGAPSILNLCKYQKAQIQVEARQQVRKLLQFLYISLLEHRAVQIRAQRRSGGSIKKVQFTLSHFSHRGTYFLVFYTIGKVKKFLNLASCLQD